MTRKLLALSCLILLAACAATPPEKKPDLPQLETKLQKSSYALCVEYMKNLRKDDLALDQEMFSLGMNDFLAGKAIRLDENQLQKALDWVLIQRVQYHNKLSDQNLAAGKKFLEANKQNPGIVPLASGVQYRILASGDGKKKPTLADNVALEYRIKHIDGKEASSTLNKTQKPEFPVENLIKGWQEAILMMVVGDKWEIFVPGPLAYGEKGMQKKRVGPNETMIFETELLSINKPKP